jgi:hypothetical protein
MATLAKYYRSELQDLLETENVKGEIFKSICPDGLYLNDELVHQLENLKTELSDSSDLNVSEFTSRFTSVVAYILTGCSKSTNTDMVCSLFKMIFIPLLRGFEDYSAKENEIYRWHFVLAEASLSHFKLSTLKIWSSLSDTNVDTS